MLPAGGAHGVQISLYQIEIIEEYSGDVAAHGVAAVARAFPLLVQSVIAQAVPE
jgi:hypothetical protein